MPTPESWRFKYNPNSSLLRERAGSSMAPATVASAKAAHERTLNRLKTACTSLEHQLPPLPPGEEYTFPDNVREDRVPAATECALCTAELDAMDAGERAGHVCTHDQGVQSRRDDEQSEHGSDLGSGRITAQKVKRNKQPKAGVIREYMGSLNTCLEAFTDAVSNLCTLLRDRGEKEMYQDHLIVWVSHCEDMKDRARE